MRGTKAAKTISDSANDVRRFIEYPEAMEARMRQSLFAIRLKTSRSDKKVLKYQHRMLKNQHYTVNDVFGAVSDFD
jgi:hypothetical protein